MRGAQVIILVGTLLYVISPIDLLPFNPLDDMIVFFGGLILNRLAGGR